MWRSINAKLYNLYQYLDLIFGSARRPINQPSENTIQAGQALFELLQCRKNAEDDDGVKDGPMWQYVKALLRQVTDPENLCEINNNDGYNPALVAVLAGDQDVLRLMISEGCDVNHGRCTLPLHLACRLGNCELVQFLLNMGAKVEVKAGMCYPQPHFPIRHVPSRFHFLETDIFACDTNHELPILFAIRGDHVAIVQCLLEWKGLLASNWPYHSYPLHYACKCGAFRCVEYLATVQPSEINTIDEEGFTPLLHAVQWGKKLVKFLIDSGASIHAHTPKKQNALHMLYDNIKEPLEIYKTTKFLLGTGLEQDINRTDHHGNTCIHNLVMVVNRLLPSFTDKHGEASIETCQLIFDRQIVDTMELLLRFNCDPNLVNDSGVTALHKLLMMLDFVISNDPNGFTLEMLPTRGKFKVDLDMLSDTLKVLLQHCADPNALTGSGRNTLMILLQVILNVEACKMGHCQDGFLNCLSLICQNGAQPSKTLKSHINIVTTLAKMGHRCLSERNVQLQDTMSQFLKELLALLLQHGLHSNHCTNLRKPPAEGGSGNILLEMVKLSQYIRQPADLLHIHDWVLTLLQWGANPDIEPYPSDPIICHSQSSIFLKAKGTQAVNQYMYEIQDFGQIFEGGYAEKLLLLFYNSMDHEALFQCMNTAKFLSRFDPNRSPNRKFLMLVHNLSSQPRSLRQIARVAIYKAMNRQLKLKVSHLPLPKPMQQYLLNVE